MLRELLNRAVVHNRGEMTVDDIVDLVDAGRMGVMVEMAGDDIALAVAFEVIPYPQRKVLNIAFVGGKNLQSLADQREKFHAIAKAFGADTMTCSCRPSMVRYLRRLSPDVQQAYVVLEWKVPL